ncbi:MAG: helix-turn-helix domain-containing protein [Stellaceae bacterium]
MGRPSKLTDAQKAEARRRRAEGATLAELARSYDVGKSTISSDRNCALASTICLTMANRSKVLRREAVDAGHGHHVAGREGVEHFEKLAPVVVRARHLLTVNLGASRAV